MRTHPCDTGKTKRPRPRWSSGWRRAGWRAALALALIACADPPRLSADGETLQVTPVPLREGTRGPADRIGKLRFLAGFALSADDPRFGGFSGLWVAPEGGSLIAVSDAGRRLVAGLDHGPDQVLRGVHDAELDEMPDVTGTGFADGQSGDVEALEPTADGGYLVALERRHRVLRYAGLGRGAIPTPSPVTIPEDLAPPGSNGGIEALARLPDGSLLAFIEGPDPTVQNVDGTVTDGWVRTDGTWRRFGYRTRGYRVTAADTLADGSIVLLERRWTPSEGVRVRVMRLPADDIRPDRVVEPELLALLEPPVRVDNFEGLAAREGPGGRQLLYLISDDNFNRSVQFTYLFQFALEE